MYNLHITQPSKSLIAILQRFTAMVLFFIVFADNATAIEETSAYENMIFRMKDNDKYYYVNIDGERITPSIYNGYSYDFGEGFAAVCRNDLYGIIDRNGKEIIPCEYRNIEFSTEMNGMNIFCINKDGKYALFNADKRIMTNFIYEECFAWLDYDINLRPYYDYKMKAIPCTKNGKQGLVNAELKEITPFIYTDIIASGEYCKKTNLIYVSKGENRWGALDSEGNEIAPCIHNKPKSYVHNYEANYETLFQISSNGQWVNYERNKSVKLGDFDIVFGTNNGLAVACKNDLYGVINLNTGKLVIPCIYKALRDDGSVISNSPIEINEYFIEISSNCYWRCAIANRNGDIISDEIFIKCCEAVDDDNNVIIYAQMDESKKAGAINLKGEIVPFIYDYMPYFHTCQYSISHNEEYIEGLIDRNHNIIIPQIYKEISDYCKPDGSISDQIKVRNLDGKAGYISPDNKVIVPMEYDFLKETKIAKGFAEFRKDLAGDKTLYGVVNITNGEIVSSAIENPDGNNRLFFQYMNTLQPSDVDKNIPANSLLNDRTFAVIIANEEYSESGISKVNYAHNDGEIFKKYCEQALGIPSSNIRFVKDATFNQIRSSVNWISDRAKVFDGEAELLIYYSGHGIPDEKDGKAYLMPSDGIANDTRSYYSLAELYDQIGALPSKKSVILLDACFSGTSKEGNMMLANTKGIALKHEPEPLTGKTVVFSAAQGDETAFSYNRKKHSLFTYYLLKKLQEGEGKVSLGELSTYVNKKVRQESVLKLGKTQTPTVNVSDVFADKWESLTL